MHASLSDIEEWASISFTYGYTIDVGSASSVEVETILTTFLDSLPSGPMQTFTSTDSFSNTMAVSLTPEDYEIDLELIGYYQESGVDKAITATVAVPISMTPGYFDCGGEFGTEGDFALWVCYEPRSSDPHADEYSFEATAFNVTWYDDMDNSLGTTAAAPVSALTYSMAYGAYNFEYNGPVTIPPGAVRCEFHFTIRDTTTGKSFSCTSNLFDLV